MSNVLPMFTAKQRERLDDSTGVSMSLDKWPDMVRRLSMKIHLVGIDAEDKERLVNGDTQTMAKYAAMIDEAIRGEHHNVRLYGYDPVQDDGHRAIARTGQDAVTAIRKSQECRSDLVMSHLTAQANGFALRKVAPSQVEMRCFVYEGRLLGATRLVRGADVEVSMDKEVLKSELETYYYSNLFAFYPNVVFDLSLGQGRHCRAQVPHLLMDLRRYGAKGTGKFVDYKEIESQGGIRL